VRSTIDATDQLVRAMDAARVELGMSKAELARRIGAKPEIVRRLFTARTANPTLNTVAQIADVLGLRLDLVPASAKRSGASATGTRARAAAALVVGSRKGG
jgi:ribosome-binding protein aMBF1 (putative translation factor)